MNFTTLSISIGIVIFCLSWNIVNALSTDLTVNSYNNGLGVIGNRTAPKNYTDTGISPDENQFNRTQIFNSQNPEVASYGGFYGYSGISMVGILYDTILKASVNLGGFLRELLGISNTPGLSAAYTLTELIQWGIILNHTFVIIQLVFRPLGYEL